jgi:chromosomal replication initiator protein
MSNNMADHIKTECIFSIVKELTGISRETIQSKSRRRHIVKARMMAAWSLRKFTDYSYPEIGKILNRNHASIIYFVRKFNERVMEKHKIKTQEKCYGWQN